MSSTLRIISRIQLLLAFLNKYYRGDREYIDMRTKILFALDHAPHETINIITDYFKIHRPLLLAIKQKDSDKIKEYVGNNYENDFSSAIKKSVDLFDNLSDSEKNLLLSKLENIVVLFKI